MTSPTAGDHLPAATAIGRWASEEAPERTLTPPTRRTDYLLAMGIALSCFIVVAVLIYIAADLLAESGDLDDEAEESIMGFAGLGTLAVGAMVGLRSTSLAGARAWLVVAVGAFVVMLGVVGIGEWLATASDGLLSAELPFYAVLIGTILWLIARQRDPSSRAVASVAIAACVAGALVLLSVSDRSSDWLGPAIAAALVTALLIVWGINAQRSRPERRWPVLAVGLAAGLVAGLAMIQASWAESRWPNRRKLSDAIAASVGALLVLVAVWTAFEPPFGLGPTIRSGHIERPATGYAMTLPEPWLVEDVSAEQTFFGEEIPVGSGVDLIARHGDGGQVALVLTVDEDLDFSAKETAALFRMGFSMDPGYSEVQSEIVALPAGDTPRLDAVLDDEMPMSVYVFSTGERGYLMLQFMALEPPDDRWLSVAETFELLPALEEARVAR